MTKYFTAMLITAALGIGFLLGSTDRTDDSTIGDHEVPRTLTCEEDEVIGFDPLHPAPRSLSCVPVQEVGGK